MTRAGRASKPSAPPSPPKNNACAATGRRPGNALGRELADTLGVALTREANALDLMKRPELDYARLMTLPSLGPGVDDAKVAEQVEIGVKYAGYLDRQRDEIARQQRTKPRPSPTRSTTPPCAASPPKCSRNLARVRPQTIGQAQRIPGMTPAAISLLLVHLARHKATRVA
jgi:tRNA uridine 5-carboxymethylaminomethyl modification enzyme